MHIGLSDITIIERSPRSVDMQETIIGIRTANHRARLADIKMAFGIRHNYSVLAWLKLNAAQTDVLQNDRFAPDPVDVGPMPHSRNVWLKEDVSTGQSLVHGVDNNGVFALRDDA